MKNPRQDDRELIKVRTTADRLDIFAELASHYFTFFLDLHHLHPDFHKTVHYNTFTKQCACFTA
jgi:hypothetical protein